MSSNDEESRGLDDLDSGWGEPSPTAPPVLAKPATKAEVKPVPVAPKVAPVASKLVPPPAPSSTMTIAAVDAGWDGDDDDEDDDEDDLDALDEAWPEITEEEKKRGVVGLTAAERKALHEQKAKKKAERRRERASLVDTKQKKKKKKAGRKRDGQRMSAPPPAQAKDTRQKRSEPRASGAKLDATSELHERPAEDHEGDADDRDARPSKAEVLPNATSAKLPWVAIAVGIALLAALAAAFAMLKK